MDDAQIATQGGWLMTIGEALRQAHWALDDSEDRTDHIVMPMESVEKLNAALDACMEFEPDDQAWDGPGPLAAVVQAHIDTMAAENARLRASLTWAVKIIPELLHGSLQILSRQGSESFNEARAAAGAVS